MPISMGNIGETYTIRTLTGSGDVRAHLEALGFNAGTEVRVVSKLGGNVILAVRESRIAVNEEQARHILV